MKVIKKRKYLPLSIDYTKLYLIEDDIKEHIEVLDTFLDGLSYMNNRDFSKKVLCGTEIKSNNTIEGYLDDIFSVRDIIRHKENIKNEDQKRRILNMYYGYKYILQGKDINKDSLKELYNILSKKLLSDDDINNMGNYYRNNQVYIFYSSVMGTKPDEGVDASLLEEKMNTLFKYIKDNNHFSSLTEYFICSQIIHFYFVYLHPYYDLNGRTSRSLAMWYLLNNQAYPYIIFNRAIQLDKSRYYSLIRDAKKYHNISNFLSYMLKNVLSELEKEYTIKMIEDNSNNQLSEVDYLSLYYILSMKSDLNYYNYTSFYNNLNDKKKVDEIYHTMLESLIDKEIIMPGKKCKNGNCFFNLNSHYVEQNEKNKHLRLINKI